MKGKLIVIDGTDGSGKHTQTMLLKENLEKNWKILIYWCEIILYYFLLSRCVSTFFIKR